MTLLEGIDGVVFDVDGTLLHAGDPGGVRGAHPVPGAIEAVTRVRASGRRILLFTNGTGRPPADYAADLRSVGFELDDDEFMNPAVVAARYIARTFPGLRVLVLGGAGVVAPLHDLGVETVDADADVVLVGWDDVLTYAQLQAACDAVWAGAPLLATSTAPVFSIAGRAAPGWSGAVVAGIEQTTGARALTLGKPSPAALEEICRALDAPPARTLVVGDDLDLEIEMARAGGARTALVLTGISSAADVAARSTEQRPDAILRDVSQLLRPTVVLVHGAWAGSWCWERVVPLLEQEGLAVRTVDLPSVGAPAGDPTDLFDDVASVTAVLDEVGGPVVLCGHSYGGMVITCAAAGRTDVAHLVYVCAFMPDAGDSLFTLTGGPAPWIRLLDDGRTIPEETHGFVDCDAETRAAAVARRRPQVTAPFGEPVPEAAWRTLPSTYVVCAHDESLPVELQRDVFAPRAGDVVELESGHAPFYAQPEQLAALIAARAE